MDEKETKSEPEIADEELCDPVTVTDEHGIPSHVVHKQEQSTEVWRYIHKLATPLEANGRTSTHICLLCMGQRRQRSSAPSLWRSALLTAASTSNANKHIKKMHPDHTYGKVLAAKSLAAAKRKVGVYDAALETALDDKTRQNGKKQTDIRYAFSSSQKDSTDVAVYKWLVSCGTL